MLEKAGWEASLPPIDHLLREGGRFAHAGAFEAALACFERCAARWPDHPTPLLNQAWVLKRLGRYEAALASYRQALALDPDNPELHWNLSLLLLQLGQFGEGFTEYEWRWRWRGLPSEPRDFGVPPWRLALEPGETVLIHGEQGFGDTLQFARWIPALAGHCKKLYFEVQPELYDLFVAQGWPCEVIRQPSRPADITRSLAVMSIPYVLGIDRPESFRSPPYLQAPARGTLRSDGRLAVGLVWRGRPTHGNDSRRSLALQQLRPLFDIAGVRWVSLSAQDLGEEIAACGLAGRMEAPIRPSDTFADTACQLSELDLVISVDTSVAHLAGALGTPTWLLLPHQADWRWGISGARTSWYDGMRLFRCPADLAWDSVISQVFFELTSRQDSMNFSIYYAGDAYSTANKIMGRQSAGKAFIKGVARTWPQGRVRGIGADERAARAMLKQLQADGFTGELKWSHLPDWQVAREAGTLYYPAPPAKDFAAARNLAHPAAFSLMGVTHTLSSIGAMDQVAELVLPPFQPWDALICTSRAARVFVSRLHDEMRAYWRGSVGATRFVDVQLPVIPLGVDVPAFTPQPGTRETARAALALRPDETAFLFAGRLSFHAKANPVPVYQALEKAARQAPLVCIEAGVFPNEAIRQGYLAAQKTLAPSVRFLWVDGQDEARYRQAWQGADVFVSLSDNIQETFGLTPLEAMAAGLPVVVSDWDGYKDTVRDGIDGFRIPTVLPPAGVGSDLALRHALGLDTYDFYIGRTSLATVVEPNALAEAFRRLATDAELRQRLGAAGRARAQQDFDWPVILHRYAELAGQLGEIRRQHLLDPAQPWPQRADPFARFAHFPSATLGGDWAVLACLEASTRLQSLLSLSMANYAFDPQLLSPEALSAVLAVAEKGGHLTVNRLLAAAGQATPMGVRALMWLWKFDLVQIAPGAKS